MTPGMSPIDCEVTPGMSPNRLKIKNETSSTRLGCIVFGSLRSTVSRVGESILCGYDHASDGVEGHRPRTGDANRHRRSHLKVATGFELTKQFLIKKLQKTLVENVEIRGIV